MPHQLLHSCKLPALCAENEAAGSPLWQANKIVQEVKALALCIGSMPSAQKHQVRSQLTHEMNESLLDHFSSPGAWHSHMKSCSLKREVPMLSCCPRPS